MGRTAYLIWKRCGPRKKDPCRYNSAFCRRAESLSLASTSRGEPDKRRRRRRRKKKRRAASSVGFTVATETMSSLLNTCFWWHHMPGLSTHNERFTSIPGLNPATGRWGVCVCVCVGLGEVCVWDNHDWNSEEEAQVCSLSLLWILVDLWAAWYRAHPQAGRRIIFAFVYCECSLLVCLECISGKKKKNLCGREVGELSLLGLIYKKRKHPEGRQSSVA